MNERFYQRTTWAEVYDRLVDLDQALTDEEPFTPCEQPPQTLAEHLRDLDRETSERLDSAVRVIASRGVVPPLSLRERYFLRLRISHVVVLPLFFRLPSSAIGRCVAAEPLESAEAVLVWLLNDIWRLRAEWYLDHCAAVSDYPEAVRAIAAQLHERERTTIPTP